LIFLFFIFLYLSEAISKLRHQNRLGRLKVKRRDVKKTNLRRASPFFARKTGHISTGKPTISMDISPNFLQFMAFSRSSSRAWKKNKKKLTGALDFNKYYGIIIPK